MRRSVFFKNPIRKLAKDPNIPDLWIREAWESNAGFFREIVTEELARYVSKYATMMQHKNWTSVLSKALSCDQLIELYVNIRDLSGRFEPEWREEFMQLFPSCIDALPPADREGTRLYYSIDLFERIAKNDASSFPLLKNEIDQYGLKLEILSLNVDIMRQLALPLPKNLEIGELSKEVTALEYAKLLGNHEIINLLEKGRTGVQKGKRRHSR